MGASRIRPRYLDVGAFHPITLVLGEAQAPVTAGHARVVWQHPIEVPTLRTLLGRFPRFVPDLLSIDVASSTLPALAGFPVETMAPAPVRIERFAVLEGKAAVEFLLGAQRLQVAGPDAGQWPLWAELRLRDFDDLR